MEKITAISELAPQKRFDIVFGTGNLCHARTEDPFVKISKQLKWNIKPDNTAGKDFTLTTLGLYTYIRMLPPNWEFSIKGLQAVLPNGRESIQHEIQILEKHGYIIRVRAQDADGRFGKKILWVTLENSEDYPHVLAQLISEGFQPYGKNAYEPLNA